MATETHPTPPSSQASSQAKAPVTERKKPTTEHPERPPQQDDLVCTICHMPSCWR